GDGLLLEPDVVARIEMARGEREHLGEVVVPARLGDAGVDQRRESARARGTEGDALLGRRAPTDGVVHLLTREDELHRAAHDLGGRGGERDVRPGGALAAEATADERGD